MPIPEAERTLCPEGHQLAEFEAQLALCTLGLDPQLGWAHVDAPYRASAALDLLEAIRPIADAFVAELVTHRTFSRREFVELPTGQVRLGASLAKVLAEAMLPIFERAVAQPAEQLAATIGASTATPVRVRTRLTNADRKRGRLGRGSKRAPKIPSACRSCGDLLDDPGRTFCSTCVPGFKQERTGRLKHAARKSSRRCGRQPTTPRSQRRRVGNVSRRRVR